jgi:hypothetical protein
MQIVGVLKSKADGFPSAKIVALGGSLSVLNDGTGVLCIKTEDRCGPAVGIGLSRSGTRLRGHNIQDVPAADAYAHEWEFHGLLVLLKFGMIDPNNSFYGWPLETLIGARPQCLKYWQKAFSADKVESPGDNK